MDKRKRVKRVKRITGILILLEKRIVFFVKVSGVIFPNKIKACFFWVNLKNAGVMVEHKIQFKRAPIAPRVPNSCKPLYGTKDNEKNSAAAYPLEH